MHILKTFVEAINYANRIYCSPDPAFTGTRLQEICELHMSFHTLKSFLFDTPLIVMNFHKFKHNISNTLNPLCPTNDGIEDTEHFLLLCHAYDKDGRDLLNSVGAILRPHGLTNL